MRRSTPGEADDRALARQLLDANEAHRRERSVDSALALVRAQRRLERTLLPPCEWTARCGGRAAHRVWSPAPGGTVERRVCLDHIGVALAIGYMQGRPPTASRGDGDSVSR